MKKLFIDHAFHNSTKSSSFMIGLLREYFDLDILFIDPHKSNIELDLTKLNLTKYDSIILWQIDWLAPYFLHRGFKVIVMPMYDGSFTLDELHWRAARGALFINFSLRLHNIVTNAGCNSIYARYFPDCKTIKANPSFAVIPNSKPSAFFWERRPDTMLNSYEICRLLYQGISHLHIHQAPDPGLSPTKIPDNLPFTVSTSNWFTRSEDYLECVNAHDIYIAPRYTEGIGMGFLEAMAIGKVVIAHDEPTHNEYIKNDHNGILFNAFRGDVLTSSPDDIRRIAHNAITDASEMQRSWHLFYKPLIIKRIHAYVKSGSIGERFKFRKKISDFDMLRGLMAAHKCWEDYYSTLNMMENDTQVSQLKQGVMDEVARLELAGDETLARNLLNSKIYQFGEISPYKLFLDLLLKRHLT
jgi:glycosyltransferase involved in cell wall biosynthesis